jgi:hypothetical protein
MVGLLKGVSMKISVNDVELFTLTDTQKAVIKNDINADEFDTDMKRRLLYILEHKYEQCFNRLKSQWEQKLAARYAQVPTDKDSLAQLIFEQPDYKDRKARDLVSIEPK